MKAITLKYKPRHPRLLGMDLKRASRVSRSAPTPFMLLRTKIIRENIARLRRALPGIDIYYAVKANNHLALIRALNQENCYFDISSVRELNDVLSVGDRKEWIRLWPIIRMSWINLYDSAILLEY